MKPKRAAQAVALGLGSIALTLSMASTATGAAEESPVGGQFAHSHHIHTGSGCVDIAAVLFEPTHRGLHRGAEEGALWHGTCSGLTFPGGPPLPPFVPHH